MKSSERMKPVQRYTELKEQNAARALGVYQQKLDSFRQRLRDLEEYRDEYCRQYLSAGQNGITAARLQGYQAFLLNLNQAIEQQKNIIQGMDAEYERLKRQWLAARNRTKAIETVVDRYQAAENKAEERKIQKETDDRNNQNTNR